MSTRPRLLVLDDREGRVAAAPGTSVLRELADLTFLDRPLADVPDEDLADVRVVLAMRERTRFDAATFDRLPRLELLLQTGGHAYHVEAAAARDRGVIVALGRRAVAARAAVPELTFALAIAALRRFPEAQRAMESGQWPALVGRCLSGRRLGILGMGRHGTNVARIGTAFGMDTVAWARPGSISASDRSGGDAVPRVPLEELLATSDVVSVQLRLSNESRGLLDADRLQAMKPGSVLVNTARGAIVDEQALVNALRSGPISAAGLDVFAEEPLPAGHPLRTLPNVILTPHVGWTVDEVFTEFAQIAAEQLADYLAERLDREELLDPTVEPRESDRVGGLQSG